MCGIFGFMFVKPVSLSSVFEVLERLEVHQYPQEPTPMGGFGAGVAVLLEDGSVVSEKVGKVEGSPSKRLARNWQARVRRASVLVSHVRMPSPEFMTNARFRETAQPYVVQLDPDLTVISVHNGKVENYVDLRKKLDERHVFESEKIQLVDSEIIPHYFEELLHEKEDVDEALSAFSCALQGSSTISILQVSEEETFLHFVHKGKTRGLTVWTNKLGEVIFCSRKEPLTEEFRDIIAHDKFKEKVSIQYREEAGLQLSFRKALE